MERVREVETQLRQFKAYFPTRVRDMNFAAVCENEELSADECRRLEGALGSDFFSAAPQDAKPVTNFDQQYAVRGHSLPLVSYVTQNGQNIPVMRTCSYEGERRLKTMTGADALLFQSSLFFEDELTEICEIAVLDPQNGRSLQSCQTTARVWQRGQLIYDDINNTVIDEMVHETVKQYQTEPLCQPNSEQGQVAPVFDL